MKNFTNMTINKLYYLFFAFILLQACNIESVDNPDAQENPEEETEEPNDNTLIKRIVYNQGTSEEYTEVFNYSDGNKLMSIDAGEGYKNVYTYSGDLLVKEESYFDNELWAYVILEYNSEGLLTQYIEYWEAVTAFPSRAYKKVFSYNSDNTITKTIYIGDHASQTELSHTELISFRDNNISSVKHSDDVVEYIYSYDQKNGIFKNIHMIEILNILSENEFGPYMHGSTSNLTSNIENYNNNVGEEFYEYTYNEDEYPETAISKFKYNGVLDEDQTETVHFYYE